MTHPHISQDAHDCDDDIELLDDGSCWRTCYQCGGEGLGEHDCGEDTCCCLYPEDNVECHICEGEGGWKVKGPTE